MTKKGRFSKGERRKPCLNHNVTITSQDALIIVDVQKDFCPGGALPVSEGDKVVPVLNKYIKKFADARAVIVATRDWHPPNHRSFKKHGGIWPTHCVQGTDGAKFHPDLKLPEGINGTGLAEKLKKIGVKRVFVGGLATDYCVKSTVMDAVKSGFETFLLEDAVRGVDVNPGDSEKAVQEMLAKGAKKLTVSHLK